jgi:hypothetical protein
MHGLINKAIERFLRETYGDACWQDIARAAGTPEAGFECMLVYDAADTFRLLDAAQAQLDKPRAQILEDIGTFLVSHPGLESLRRLLRFGGDDFVEFLHSLDDLPERARLAVPDLDLPRIELREHAANHYSVISEHGWPGFGSVIVGLLRAIADDYGALVLLDHKGGREGTEVVEVRLLEQTFAKGRAFHLGARTG